MKKFHPQDDNFTVQLLNLMMNRLPNLSIQQVTFKKKLKSFSPILLMKIHWFHSDRSFDRRIKKQM